MKGSLNEEEKWEVQKERQEVQKEGIL
jgi:hypothetical protein